jgi:hypothetical protein
VPRLSIIVPHLQDDTGLEQTLVSILENRGRSLELVIVHDGSYTDPYGLNQDEAVLIETKRGTSLTSQLNLAIASARSPYIQVLSPGAVVAEGWYDEALEILEQGSVEVVCQPIACTNSDEIVSGLSASSLPHRRVTGSVAEVGSPLMVGSIMRKRFVDALGGWMERSTREIAEVEMGLLLSALGVEIAIAESVGIQGPRQVVSGQESGYEIGYACGQLACAYATIENSGVVIDSVARRLGHLASGLMSPKTVAERLGWVLGVKNRAFVETIQRRLARAQEAVANLPSSMAVQDYSMRRAA